MPLVRIDARRMADWPAFHDTFAEAFGFPDFYGCNLNAWVDCMSDLGEPDAGMTTVHGSAADPVVLRIDHADEMPASVVSALVDCVAFVNLRSLEAGKPPVLVLAYDRPSDATPEHQR